MGGQIPALIFNSGLEQLWFGHGLILLLTLYYMAVFTGRVFIVWLGISSGFWDGAGSGHQVPDVSREVPDGATRLAERPP